ncbi:hypothetical protein HR45_00590 [Shewanella mangrovi]|uniref:Uncharacterized protein n=1 Tax=Shewanella mangrovi TaxID=1515746 RepID=A0A094K2P5_9GAMM|nr:hypothetical protein [Shewanella mangrovi]KFZ38936.1 hypothetical protein HR45_00590 [Shewanella mangrovi]
MRIILLLIVLVIIAWLSLDQIKTISPITDQQNPSGSEASVPQNAQDLKQLKSNLDSLVQKSAENTQQKIDEATNQDKNN